MWFCLWDPGNHWFQFCSVTGQIQPEGHAALRASFHFLTGSARSCSRIPEAAGLPGSSFTISVCKVKATWLLIIWSALPPHLLSVLQPCVTVLLFCLVRLMWLQRLHMDHWHCAIWNHGWEADFQLKCPFGALLCVSWAVLKRTQALNITDCFVIFKNIKSGPVRWFSG